MSNTLPKTDILRGYEAFAEVVRNGMRVHSGCLQCHLLFLPRLASGPEIQMGFAVPKKRIRRAVDRNRIRRLMREVFRMNRDSLRVGVQKAGKDLRIVVVFQHNAATSLRQIVYRSIEHDWNQIAAKILSAME